MGSMEATHPTQEVIAMPRQLRPQLVTATCPVCHSPNSTFALVPLGLECGGCGCISTSAAVKQVTGAEPRPVR